MLSTVLTYAALLWLAATVLAAGVLALVLVLSKLRGWRGTADEQQGSATGDADPAVIDLRDQSERPAEHPAETAAEHQAPPTKRRQRRRPA